MKSLKKVLAAMSLFAVLGMFIVPVMAVQQNDVVRAGFTGLPLRNCQGTYCAELKKLNIDQQLRVIAPNMLDGWLQVEIVGTGEKGWVCTQNVY